MQVENAPLRVNVPVLETERLRLREPREADLDAIADFMASDRAIHVGGPMDRQESWRNILMMLGHWTLRGYGYWVIEERATGAIAGRTGVHYHAVDWPEPELGWQVFAGFEGRGYAAEAVVAARRATVGLGIIAPISLIVPENARSRTLAEKLGAIIESEMQFRGKTAIVYRHPKETA